LHHNQKKPTIMQKKIIITIVYWLLVAAFVIPGYLFGFQKLFAEPRKLADFTRWGYSTASMRFLGLGEIAALTSLLFTATRYACFIFFCIILAGAIYTHTKNNDGKKQMMTPIIVWAHMAVIFILSNFIN